MSDRIPASDRDVQSTDNVLVSPELLRIQNMTLEEQLAEFEAEAGTVPARIDSDDVCAPWQDLIKDMDGLAKTIETTRETAKEPFLSAGRIVDGYFKALSETKGTTPGRLQRARYAISQVVLGYLNRKEAAARAERQRLADIAREEERKALEKAEAERAAARKAEEDGRKRAAANATSRADQAEADASSAEARAFEAEQQAKARPAELARTRSASGSLGTIKVSWDFEIIDLDSVKGAPLWSYVSRNAKEQAIRAFIKANAPTEIADDADYQPLTGVRLIRKRNLSVR